jgi:hypothetical protein
MNEYFITMEEASKIKNYNVLHLDADKNNKTAKTPPCVN